MLKSRVLWTAVLLLVMYVVVANLSGPNYWILAELTSSFRFGVGMMVVILFAPLAIKVLRSNRVEREDHLILGITLGWASVSALSAWGITSRMLGVPSSVTESMATGFLVYTTALAGVLHITAPASNVRRIQHRNVIMLMTAALIGGAIAGASIVAVWITGGTIIKDQVESLPDPYNPDSRR